MFEQFLGALLFLLGFQTGGSVRGESTPSAKLTNVSLSTASGEKAAATLSAVKVNNMAALQEAFQGKLQHSLSVWETKHTSFSASLKVIKNAKKVALLETVQNTFIEINKSQSTLLMTKLEHLSAALEEIKRVAEKHAQETGKDPSKVVSAIEAANKAIADAVAAVTAQGEKQYVVSISTEASLKTNVEAQKTQLTTDLKKVRDTVKNVRKKVGEALKALRTFSGTSDVLKIAKE